MDSTPNFIRKIHKGAQYKELLKSFNLTQDDVSSFWMNHSDPDLSDLFDYDYEGDVEEASPLCNLGELRRKYVHVHGYLSLVVCIFGTIANILNIVVLTRKEMNGSPINRILTGIAVADMMVMVEYIPTAVHLYLWTGRSDAEQYSWSWSAFVWFHVNFSIVIHNVSIWLTLSLAVWRFIMIRFHALAPVYCTMARCKILLFFAYVMLLFVFPTVVPIFLTIPNCIAMTLHKSVSPGTNVTMFVVTWSRMAKHDDRPQLLYYVNIWLYSFILKLLPCIVLTVITGFLVRALYRAEERSARLKGGYRKPSDLLPRAPAEATLHHNESAPPIVANGGNATVVPPATHSPQQQLTAPSNKRKRNVDRTTRLLIAILVLFLLTEFPQGILGLLSAIQGDEFFKQCYMPLGELMDAMALTNSAINFILYCFMSKQFRKTFAVTFRLQRCLPKLSYCCCPCSSLATASDPPQFGSPVVAGAARGLGNGRAAAAALEDAAEMIAMVPEGKHGRDHDEEAEDEKL